ncbi:hypothetical protein B296_00004764 [Ensete ventricosum]|uniref:Uncharacterized protein n=1 Tax=Ensete ventricosum TaxID=4639 RepID=A0A426YHA4_ENSVE|nr:hypothetical protein B296_00004764 [Ensete ventricosum]
MRLNRVELFYMFLLYFHNDHNKDGGSPYEQAPCKGDHSRPGHQQGRSVVARAPIGAITRGSTHKGVACEHRQHPQRRRLWGRHPPATEALMGIAPIRATTRGQGCSSTHSIPLTIMKILSMS